MVFRLVLPIVLCSVSLTACEPEVGSDAWCENMIDKSKGDWTANEATEFARSCVFKNYEDE
ncbi:MAG: DUF3012 domain-containing protein [Gammaproteobacteria bacterium]|nr:MAG: DUF3012 domain-containing protein [Gammaproteobacteria bacterium]